MVQYDADDAHSAALCAWKEARGEGANGMRAVLHVIANRVGSPGFAHDVHGVVFGKNQFTSMSVPSDPEFNLQPKDGDAQFAYCSNLVGFVLEGKDVDITGGARYYDNPKTATSGWFTRHIVNDPVNHPQVATIGHQVFYL